MLRPVRLPRPNCALCGSLALSHLRRLRLGLGNICIGVRCIALGDRGNGSLGRGLLEIFGEQVAHDGVARAAAAASHHHADQMAVAAAHRGHKVEAGRAGVAGLDAIDAIDAAEQMIVVADRLAVIIERLRREVAVVARETVLDGAAQRRLIARRRHLVVVGQAGGIAIDRLGHAERACLAGHQLGEIVFIAGDGFRDHDGGVIGRARHQSLDGVFDADGLTRAQAEFGRSLLGGVLGHLHFGVELHLAGIETLEQQIQRHDLGERGGMTAGVRIVGGKRGARIAVDDDRGKCGAVALPRHVVVGVVGIVAMPVATRLGSVACEDDGSGECDQPENASSQNARGSQGCTKHELPRPNFCLDHRFVRPNYARRR